MIKASLLLVIIAILKIVSGHSPTHILNGFAASGYDKRVRPSYGSRLSINVSLEAFTFLHSTNNEIKFNLDWYMRWNDLRVAFRKSHTIDEIAGSDEVVRNIWVPELVLPEGNGYTRVSSRFITVNHNGTISMRERYSVSLYCETGFNFFPLDRQICRMELGNPAFSSKDIDYIWVNCDKTSSASASLSLSSSSSSSSVKVKNYLHGFDVDEIKHFKYFDISHKGNYSRLVVEVILDRCSSGYIFRFFLPAILMVVLSWSAIPFRREKPHLSIALSITSCLSLVILLGLNSVLITSKDGPSTGLDIYLVGCLLLGALALVVCVKASADANNINTESSDFELEPSEKRESLWKRTTKDITLRALFFLFLLFNTIYWITCLTVPLFSPSFSSS